MKRGEIYYIERRNCFNNIGEAPKARPGVIVSADTLNATSTTVMVVYLTTHPQQSLPTHVCIHATGTPSTVLCERIDYVPIEMLGNYAGTCTEKELAAIERGMLKALGMEQMTSTAAGDVQVNVEPQKAHDAVNHPSHYTDGKIEVIDYIEDKKLNYHLGNAVKYISRAGKKDPTKKVEDLRKAAWYINREIERLTKEEIA